MSRFKVGEIVEIRKNLEACSYHDGGCYIAPDMLKYCGVKCKVIDVSGSINFPRYLLFSLEEARTTGWYWSDSMLIGGTEHQFIDFLQEVSNG